MSISISLVAARTSGVAPLYVNFDATATTSTATSIPFHEVLYIWDFGDAKSATWGYGINPGVNDKNAAYGPVAAHVYETAGDYTVTLICFDANGTIAQTTQSITVTDPDTVFSANTLCVETAATGTGGPAGATYLTSSDFDAAINSTAGSGATYKRILFKGGQTFSASIAALITSTGAGYIGAYGSGKANITRTGGSAQLSFGGQNFPNSSSNLKDWRVVDLSFNGGGSSECVSFEGGFNQVTLLRVDASNGGDGTIMLNQGLLDFYNSNGHGTHTQWDQFCMADCSIGTPSTWSLFFTALRYALLGSQYDNNNNGSHVVRQAGLGQLGVISNCTIKRNGPGSAGTHVLKLHAPDFGGAGDSTNPAGSYTEKIVISDNDIWPNNNSTNNYTVALTPQDSASDERLRNIIFERNFGSRGGTNTVRWVNAQVDGFSFRNNIYNGSAANIATMLSVNRDSSGAPKPTNNYIYNNTFYSSANNVNAADESVIDIDSTATASTTSVKNNLGYAASAGSGVMVNAGVTITASNNSTNAQLRATSPSFSSATPSALADFKIQTGSYAKDAGTSVPVFLDAFAVYRPQGSGSPANWDMGFSEFDIGMTAPWLGSPSGGGGGSVSYRAAIAHQHHMRMGQ